MHRVIHSQLYPLLIQLAIACIVIVALIAAVHR